MLEWSKTLTLLVSSKSRGKPCMTSNWWRRSSGLRMILYSWPKTRVGSMTSSTLPWLSSVRCLPPSGSSMGITLQRLRINLRELRGTAILISLLKRISGLRKANLLPIMSAAIWLPRIRLKTRGPGPNLKYWCSMGRMRRDLPLKWGGNMTMSTLWEANTPKTIYPDREDLKRNPGEAIPLTLSAASDKLIGMLAAVREEDEFV